jgi:hypothetical protein
MTYLIIALISFYVIVVIGMFAVTLVEIDGEFHSPVEPDLVNHSDMQEAKTM